MSNSIDLNNPPKDHKYDVKVGPVESIAERNVRLTKDFILFIVAIVLVGTVWGFCVKTLLDVNATPDAHKWAMSMLTAAVGGMVGYLVRK